MGPHVRRLSWLRWCMMATTYYYFGPASKALYAYVHVPAVSNPRKELWEGGT